jgi:hypothetical protein
MKALQDGDISEQQESGLDSNMISMIDATLYTMYYYNYTGVPYLSRSALPYVTCNNNVAHYKKK